MFDKKLLGLIGGVGGGNLIITLILTLGLTTGQTGATGPIGPSGASGLPGVSGLPGEDGEDGLTPYIGENGNWWIGDTDTGVQAEGQDGQDGQGGTVSILETIDFIHPELDFTADSIRVPTVEITNIDALEVYQNALNASFINVSTEAELRAMEFGGAYRLTNNITLTEPWTMIGDSNTAGVITLDGGGYTISGLSISDADNNYVGMFSNLQNSVIMNLQFVGVDVINSQTSLPIATGTIAGFAVNSIFKNIQLTGTGDANTISGKYVVGGLVGLSYGSYFALNTISNTTVSGVTDVGGFVGVSEYTEFFSLNTNNLTIQPIFERTAWGLPDWERGENLGGIAGRSLNTTLFYDINVINTVIDGINGSYNAITNQVLTPSNLGGIVGTFDSGNYSQTPTQFEGITVTSSIIAGDSDVGGLVGYGYNSIMTFYDIYVYNNDLVAGSTSVNAPTFDFENPNESSLNQLGYYLGGVVGSVYNVGSLFHTVFVEENRILGDSQIGGVLGYMQADNTDETAVYFKNTVSNNVIAGGDAVGGIMGKIDSYSSYFVIENSVNHSDILSILNKDLYNVGGFIGEVYEINHIGIISNSYNTGDILNGSYDIGGFIGYNEIENIDNATTLEGGLFIYNSLNLGTVSGYENVGGFLGRQYEQDNLMYVYNSLQLGDVIPIDTNYDSEELGGFIGENASSSSILHISNSYYAARIDGEGFTLPVVGFNGSGINTELPLFGFLTGYFSNNFYTLTDPHSVLDPDNFIYEGIWNFDDVWAFDGNILYLQSEVIPD